MMSFFVSKFWTILGTALLFLAKTDFFKNKKGMYITIFIFSIICNGNFVINSHGIWYEKVYACIMILISVSYLMSVLKVKNEITFSFENKDSVIFDRKKQKKLFRSSCEQAKTGDYSSICTLAYCYANGIGTSINLKKAKQNFMKLRKSDDLFWRKIGKEGLEEIKQRNKEKHNAMFEVVKDFLENIAE